MEKNKKKIIFIYSLLVIFFFAQGFAQKTIFPFTLVRPIYNFDQVNGYTFFTFPFLWIILKFIFIFVRIILASKLKIGSIVSAVKSFFSFYVDMMMWFMAMWLAFTMYFVLGLVHIRGNLMAFILMNFYLAFFCFLQVFIVFFGLESKIKSLFKPKNNNIIK